MQAMKWLVPTVGLALAASVSMANDRACSPAELNRAMKISLGDAARNAETQVKGKAVRAICQPCTDGTLPPEVRKDVKDGKEAADTHRPGDKARPGKASEYVCIVTVATESKFVDVYVCCETGQVLGQRDSASQTLTASRNPQQTNAVAVSYEGDGNRAGKRNYWYDQPRRWHKGSDLTGKAVKNTAGEDLGKLEEIVIDPSSGRIIYGVLSFGGFLGLGDKLFAVPWSSFSIGDDFKYFTFDVSKDVLKNAQGFDKAQWPNFADQRWATDTHKFYQQSPYWVDPDSGQTMTDSRRVERDRWFRPTSGWQKSSDLIGKTIRNPQNQDLDRMHDLVIDPDTGRVLYGVIKYEGKLIAIPWTALTLSADNSKFVLNATPESLRAAKQFSNDNWPNLVDASWMNDSYRHFGQPIYWETRIDQR